MLNELADASGVAMMVEEAAIPVLPPVRAACEMLGLDPLYVANEGVCVAIVAPGTPRPSSRPRVKRRAVSGPPSSVR